MADYCSQPEAHLIFTYGTLKHGFPNYPLMESLIQRNDAVFLGPHVTLRSYPLVCGPHGIPFLINLPGSGHRITGELYSVSTCGLARLEELEGTALGHYERLPIQVVSSGNANAEDGIVPMEAEAYYAHRSFGESLWERKGREGLSEYTKRETSEYVGRAQRPLGRSFLDEVQLFVYSAAEN
ncbi:hypothetical protein CJ030_MR4G023637 [Morella rubra]|uniref:Gamma-glutamylcyclotransferase family protein n=1 Tax=Morella rubra TaxID=262757 RepID=A0A6A1VT09_9ROSI|nr:hypothetical protein CJ030_MR4G023637 [Morella rubra]